MTRKKSRAGRTADALRDQLVQEGIRPHRISYDSRNFNQSVEVTLLDANPATRARAEGICRRYQVINEDPNQPGHLIDNRRDDIPQVATVTLRNNMSDGLCATIARFLMERTPEPTTIRQVWDLFEGKNLDFWLHAQRPAAPA